MFGCHEVSSKLPGSELVEVAEEMVTNLASFGQQAGFTSCESQLAAKQTAIQKSRFASSQYALTRNREALKVLIMCQRRSENRPDLQRSAAISRFCTVYQVTTLIHGCEIMCVA